MPVFHAFRGRAPLLALAVAMLSSACGGEGTGSPPVSSPTPLQPTGPGTPGISETGGIPSGFQLVWADEFDVAGLPDPTKWSYDVDRNSAGWYNNELQYYGSARLENSRVENGMLVITARREDLSTAGLSDWSGQDYSSARLVTRDKASWTYGFMEIRAKLPCGTGTWPAIWTLSAFFREIPWEMEQAAQVDGATSWQAFRKVIVPLAAPGVFTAAILTFFFAWNEFVLALSLTSTTQARTVPAQLSFFVGPDPFNPPYGQLATASVLVTIPIIIIVLLFQRKIVAGLTSGAVKG